MTAQSLAALANANEIRLGRSAAKKQIRAGETTVAEALLLECCRSAQLRVLLECQWEWGPARTVRFCQRVGVSPHRHCGSLTERQVGLIVEGLEA